MKLNTLDQLIDLQYPDILDSLVHDVASDMASEANNGGARRQVHFLKAVGGWTDEQILAAVNEQLTAEDN